MCEYCDGIYSPVSFPVKVVYDNNEEETIQYGFLIKNKEKLVFFVEPFNEKNSKEILFERKINYCPFCGEKIGDALWKELNC